MENGKWKMERKMENGNGNGKWFFLPTAPAVCLLIGPSAY
jgi:hypothetical protein